ncbi:MAG: hypothetical protein M1831_005985 [Alyxoria varia]|nr:MAG: hypothetical protein M1831_005985 [Alyxoria varia]
MALFWSWLFAALAGVLIGLTNAMPAPVVVSPKPHQWTITQNNTVNGTHIHASPKPVAKDAPHKELPLSFVNNLNGSGSIYAYVTGTDGDGAAFFLKKDGTAWYPRNPATNIPPTTITEDIKIPLRDEGSTVKLHNYITSGRIYFSEGEMKFAVNNGEVGPVVVGPSFTNADDPNAALNYGFAEFTWTEDAGVWSNLSYVDFIGLVVSQTVSTESNGDCVVKGLPSDGIERVCKALKDQAAKDDQPWDKLCQTDADGNPIRVLSPLHLTEVEEGAMSDYYKDYIDKVWDHYSKNDLKITAGDLGTYTGRVGSDSGVLSFDKGGDFEKPTLVDILGCNSGPFANPVGDMLARKAIVPRLCAAFHRSTFLLEGGDQQPNGVDPKEWYTVEPTNHYSRIVHETEVDGRGYTFAYDDVFPSGSPDVSGLCHDPSPTKITFEVGGAKS